MVDIGEKFKVDGYELEYPGDPSAPGYLIYNCRCAVVSVDKFHDSKAPRVAENPLTGKAEIIQGMTYTEWEAKHKAENPEAWELYQKKSQNLASDKKQYAEYKAALGRKVVKSLDDFQNVKYNDSERWGFLKGYKRYISRVPDAKESDYWTYVLIKETGITGEIRVPPEKVDRRKLSLNDDHATRHGCNLADAKNYVKTAKFSITRKRWDGVSVNYYSEEGAAYINPETLKVKTAFSFKDFDDTISKIMGMLK